MSTIHLHSGLHHSTQLSLPSTLVSASGAFLSSVPGLQVLKGGFQLVSAWGELRGGPEKGLLYLEDSGGQNEAQEAGSGRSWGVGLTFQLSSLSHLGQHPPRG